MTANADSLWSSGEICEVVGKYYSQCCRGRLEAQFVAGDIFPFCLDCSKKLKWQRALAGLLPVDATETELKSSTKSGKKAGLPMKKRK